MARPDPQAPAADQIVAARGITPAGPVAFVGAIGRAALADRLPNVAEAPAQARNPASPGSGQTDP